MSDLKTRGYLITSAVKFIQEDVGDKAWPRIQSGFSAPLQQTLSGTIKPAEWYPISLLNELTRAITTSIGRGEDERARDALFRYGKSTATEATNSFLKIFLKILTPSLFAKKLPEVFRRDFSGGRLIVEVKDRTISCRMYDLPGFEHGGPLGSGFAAFPIEAMGKTIEKVTVQDWSLSAPNVDGTRFELTWRE
jgi:hypothetical protein